jgi:hypothetical protein
VLQFPRGPGLELLRFHARVLAVKIVHHDGKVAELDLVLPAVAGIAVERLMPVRGALAYHERTRGIFAQLHVAQLDG